MTGGVNNNANINHLNKLQELSQQNSVKKSDLGDAPEILNSVFDKANVDTENDTQNGEKVLANAKELTPFRKFCMNLINMIQGQNNSSGNVSETNEDVNGTKEDVKGFTYSEIKGENAEFNGVNLINDKQADGSIKTDGDTIIPGDKSLTVQFGDGSSSSLTQLPNGFLVLDGQVYNNNFEALSKEESAEILKKYGMGADVQT